MRLAFEIKYVDGGAATATAVVADFIAWEKATGKTTSDFAKGVGITDMALLAHAALKRSGQTDLKFDEWVGKVEEIGTADDSPKSTRKAVSADS